MLWAFVAEHFPTAGPRSGAGDLGDWTTEPVAEWAGPEGDAELVRLASAAKPSAATVFGGQVKAPFSVLWQGEAAALARLWPSATDTYDRSHADMTLASHLAFWTGKDCERMERLMRMSALVRDKWDSPSHRGYLETTILKACAYVTGVATGRKGSVVAALSDGRELDGNVSFEGITFDGDSPIAPPPELVKGLLPQHGVAFLGGQSGAGKTFVAVDFVVAISSPEVSDFFGRKIREHCGVLILAAEGAGTLGLRLKAAKYQRKIENDLPVACINSIPDLTNAEHFSQFTRLLVALQSEFKSRFGVRIGVIVIDTVAATFNLTDENSNAEAARVMRLMREIGDCIGALVLAVHHYGKAADTGLRGASAYKAGADAVISVLADRDEITGQSGRRSLALAKSRTTDEGPISGFDLAFVPLGQDEDGELFGSCAVAPNASVITKGRARGEKPSIVAFRRAFDSVLGVHGVELPELTGAESIRAAPIEKVRAEFCKNYGGAAGDPKKQAEAARKAFDRAVTGLPTDIKMATHKDGVQWLWRPQ